MRKVHVSSEEIKVIKQDFSEKFGVKLNIRKGVGCYKGSITVVSRTIEKKISESSNWTQIEEFRLWGKYFKSLGFRWGADLTGKHDIAGEDAHTYWNGGCQITLTKYIK